MINPIKANPRSAAWQSRLWIATLFVFVGILTRIPFRSQILNHWDSVNFALALDHYDLRLHQPHPPGPFVIYIMLGRLFNYFLHENNAALVWLSIVLSGLGIAALYLLAEEMFDRRVALTTGLLALTSPMVWFHGEVALSYILEFFWVPPILYACYRMQKRSSGALLASALLLGLAGGVRPNTPVFLFPVWLLAVFFNRYPWKKVLLSFVFMGVGVLFWAIPMVVWTGGVRAYIEQFIWWQNQHTEESGSLFGVMEFVVRFGAYLTYTLGPGLLALAWAGWRALPGGWRTLQNRLAPLVNRTAPAPGWRQRLNAFWKQDWDWRWLVMAAWILPGSFYLTVIHIRQPGHTFTVLPGYILLTGAALASLTRTRRAWLGLSGLIVAVNGVFFLAAPEYLFGDQRMLFTTPSWNAIHNYDQDISMRLESIRANFPSAETTILANGRNFRLPSYYLKDYAFPALSYQIDSETVRLAAPIHYLVLFDDVALPPGASDLKLQSIPLPNGTPMRYLAWGSEQVVEISRQALTIK